MDGEQGPRATEELVAGISVPEIGEGQRRLPVMAVDDVGGEAQGPHGFERGPGEEGEALAVIGIIAGRGPIETIAVKILRPVDEEDGHAVGSMGENGIRQLLAVHVEGCPVENRLERQVFLPDLPVERHEDPDIGAQSGEELGQGAGHVGQAARLGVGDDFGCKECDFHGPPILAHVTGACIANRRAVH